MYRSANTPKPTFATPINGSQLSADASFASFLPMASSQQLGFQTCQPAAILRPWVQCYWLARNPCLPRCGFEEKLYPDGGSTLTVLFNKPGSPQIQFEARHQLTVSHFSGHVDAIGIRFHPGGAYQLFGKNISELHGLPAIETTSLHWMNCDALQGQLADVRDNPQRLSLIEHWLLAQARQHQPQYGIIQHMWPQLTGGSGLIGQISEHINLSRRQIERKFSQQIGLSPARIRLFQGIKQARRLLVYSPQRLLTDIALDCGFYDQAHFIKQFRQLTQQTPGQYRQRKLSQIYNSTNV